jgi:phage N-6-adenine-methyltransferase
MSPHSYHSLANIFPLLDGSEFAALAEDIRATGLRQPILLFEGVILDGRNRYRACIEAGVDPRFEIYDGNDPLAYVISLNLKRRHLDESQRAMVAAKIANMGEGRPSKTSPIGEVSQAQAAEMLNVGKRSVERAAEVRGHGVPELAEKVERGQVSVSAAADVARLPEPEQREIVAAGPKAVVDVARDIRRNGMAHRTKFTGNNEWFTPQKYVELARDVLGGIDLDPASHAMAQETVRAERFFTEKDDGLQQEWFGRVWLNPPYSQPDIGYFVDKLASEFLSGNVREGILLTNNCTDAKWFHAAFDVARRICFTRGRIKFTSLGGGEAAAPVQGQAFFYFGENVEQFERVFSSIGAISEPKPCRDAPLSRNSVEQEDRP